MTEPRKPFLALLFSFIPGLGQLYNGQPGKGLIFLIIDLLIPVVFGLSGILNSLTGLILLLLYGILFLLYRLIDGFVSARKRPHYELQWYNEWYIYAGYTLALIFIRVFLDAGTSTGIQTFKIPTPSMVPTLQPYDRVVAGLTYYENNPVERGDIVIFNSPQGGIWIFRVIGMPNDSIAVRDGAVYINNKPNKLTSPREFTLDMERGIQYSEQIAPGKTISILTREGDGVDRRPFEPMVVPENEYFLMGDNRDNALDSRYIGTIKKEDILGRVLYSYWGNTSRRRNIDFTQFEK